MVIKQGPENHKKKKRKSPPIPLCWRKIRPTSHTFCFLVFSTRPKALEALHSPSMLLQTTLYLLHNTDLHLFSLWYQYPQSPPPTLQANSAHFKLLLMAVPLIRPARGNTPAEESLILSFLAEFWKCPKLVLEGSHSRDGSCTWQAKFKEFCRVVFINFLEIKKLWNCICYSNLWFDNFICI